MLKRPVAHDVPFWINSTEDLFVAGIDSVNRLGDFYLHAVSDGYFGAMGTRILRGRGITTADRQGSPLTVVVSQSMAKKLWPRRDALGRASRSVQTPSCSTVVGIAEDIRRGSFDENEGLQYYVSIDQRDRNTGSLRAYERGRQIAERADPPRAPRLMPGISYVSAMPLQDILDQNVRAWQLGATCSRSSAASGFSSPPLASTP